MLKLCRDLKHKIKRDRGNIKKKKKQVSFGFVEVKYYERSIGCDTYDEGIKLSSCYEPYERTMTYFNDHDQFTCSECFYKMLDNIKKGKEHLKHFENSNQTDETLNEFYNIHGKISRPYPLLEEECMRKLIEAGIETKEIRETLDQKYEVSKELQLLELKQQFEKHKDKEILKIQARITAKTSKKQRKVALKRIENIKKRPHTWMERLKISWLESDLEEKKRVSGLDYDNLITKISSMKIKE